RRRETCRPRPSAASSKKSAEISWPQLLSELTEPICPQPARWASATAIPPFVAMRAVSEIAAMGLLHCQIEEIRPADLKGKRKGRRLIDLHQRRVDRQRAVHAEFQRRLHGADGGVPTVRIAGIIRLAHTGDQMPGPAPVSD